MLLGDRVVCVLMAMKEGLLPFDISRARTYLKNLGLRSGVVANFSKDRLQLLGVLGDAHRLR